MVPSLTLQLCQLTLIRVLVDYLLNISQLFIVMLHQQTLY